MKPHDRSPPEILRVLAEHFRVPDPEASRLSPGAAGYLARAVDGRGSDRVASINGYALPIGFPAGECGFRLRPLEDLAAAIAPPIGNNTGETETSTPEPVLDRVGTGDPVPDACDRILPVHAARITGKSRLFVEPDALPPAGHGIEEFEPLTLPVGTPLDSRLVAYLLADGTQEVWTWPTLEVGVGCVGSELVDAATAVHSRAADRGARVANISGAWLGHAIRRLGHRTQALDTLPDDPEAVMRSLRRAAQIGLKVAVLTGGLGDGFDDRIIETLQSAPFRIFFSGAQVVPGRRILYAQGLGIELFVLGGSPLDASAAFDFFVAPCLLRALGSGTWDWSAQGPVAVPDLFDGRYPSVLDEDGEALWNAAAIRHGSEHRLPHKDDDPALTTLARIRPGVPGQWGWWLRSPTGDSDQRERYYRIPSWS